MIRSTATAFFRANDAETAFKHLRDAHHAATEARDAQAIASLYADNAFLYGPGGGVTKGKDAIFRDMSAFFSAFEQFTGSFVRHGGSYGTTFASEWGLWEMSALPLAGGERYVWKGRGLDVIEKTADGWRVVADHASYLAASDVDLMQRRALL